MGLTPPPRAGGAIIHSVVIGSYTESAAAYQEILGAGDTGSKLVWSLKCPVRMPLGCY